MRNRFGLGYLSSVKCQKCQNVFFVVYYSMKKRQIEFSIEDIDYIILNRLLDRSESEIAAAFTDKFGRNVSRSVISTLRKSDAYQNRVSKIVRIFEAVLSL